MKKDILLFSANKNSLDSSILSIENIDVEFDFKKFRKNAKKYNYLILDKESITPSMNLDFLDEIETLNVVNLGNFPENCITNELIASMDGFKLNDLKFLEILSRKDKEINQLKERLVRYEFMISQLRLVNFE